MTYATQATMTERFGSQRLIELTDRAGALDAIDTDVLGRALAFADAMIDGYVGVKYAVPVDPAPAVLVGVAEDIAYYKLHVEAAPEGVSDAYKAAERFLKAVSVGQAVLTGATGAASAATDDGVRISGPERTFSRDTLSGF